MTDHYSGDIISGFEPDEHLEIRQIKPFGAKTLIEGMMVTSWREFSHI